MYESNAFLSFVLFGIYVKPTYTWRDDESYTGEEIWRVERDEPTSWSTPVVVEHQGKPQVIISATNRIRGYDLSTGDLIW